MKKYLLIILTVLFVSTTSSAQILRADELEQYSKEKYGKNWEDAAKNLATQITLDKNNAMTFVQIIEAPEKTKEQLYTLLNYWYTSTFNNANAVISLNDKELGVIMASGYVDGIAKHTGGMNHYIVNIKPVIKCDIKDYKVRVTYTMPYYCVTKTVGGGIFGDTRYARAIEENWPLDKCVPFATKDKHKKTSFKAFVMAYAYSNVIMDKIEECIQNGMNGSEGDDW